MSPINSVKKSNLPMLMRSHKVLLLLYREKEEVLNKERKKLHADIAKISVRTNLLSVKL